MKLLFCQKCYDVFKLDLEVMRQCKCGAVKGRYIDNLMAEVSEEGISIAIGNGSLEEAIVDMTKLFRESDGEANRKEYQAPYKGKIDYAWVRPNSGAGNPHTKIIT